MAPAQQTAALVEELAGELRLRQDGLKEPE
jgi:hypothetical protein